jgi:hypothetical protein
MANILTSTTRWTKLQSGSYDPTQTSNFRLQHGAGGFGFDANDLVRVDNIVIQTVPEPASLILLGLSIPAVAVVSGRVRCRPLSWRQLA